MGYGRRAVEGAGSTRRVILSARVRVSSYSGEWMEVTSHILLPLLCALSCTYRLLNRNSGELRTRDAHRTVCCRHHRKSQVETDRLQRTRFACAQSASEKFGYIHPPILSGLSDTRFRGLPTLNLCARPRECHSQNVSPQYFVPPLVIWLGDRLAIAPNIIASG
jgi:hypothetical protein